MKILVVSRTSVFENLGGSEVQIGMIADYLRSQGHDVEYYFREDPRGVCSSTAEDGVRVFRNEERRHGYAGPAADCGRLEQIIRARRPDLLFARCYASLFVVERASSKTGVPFVYQFPGNARALVGMSALLRFARQPVKGAYGLLSRRAMKHAAQFLTISKDDADFLKRRFGLHAVALYNMHPDPGAISSKTDPALVVWINNPKPVKRPELFLELASRCRDLRARFVMSGAIPNGHYGQGLRRQLEMHSNVEYIGPTQLEEANALLGKATVNVLTSESEGFGNANIQGWLRETPIITTIDKDRVAERHGIGYCVANVDEMESRLRFALSNRAIWQAAGARAREYALSCHSVQVQGPRYMAVFESACRTRVWASSRRVGVERCA